MESLATGYMITTILGLIICVLWIFMPFAIFSTKAKLQTLIDETIANRKEIAALHQTISDYLKRPE